MIRYIINRSNGSDVYLSYHSGLRELVWNSDIERAYRFMEFQLAQDWVDEHSARHPHAKVQSITVDVVNRKDR